MALSFKLKTLVPVMSAGMRSGVNWMRPNSPPRTFARVRTERLANAGHAFHENMLPVKMAMSA